MLNWEKSPNPKQTWDWRLFSGYLLVCNFCHLLSLRGSLTVWLHSFKNWKATHKLAKRNRRKCPSYNFGTSVICFFPNWSLQSLFTPKHYLQQTSATKSHNMNYFLCIIKLNQIFAHTCRNKRLRAALVSFQRCISVSAGLSDPFRTECQTDCITLLTLHTNITWTTSVQVWKQLRKQWDSSCISFNNHDVARCTQSKTSPFCTQPGALSVGYGKDTNKAQAPRRSGDAATEPWSLDVQTSLTKTLLKTEVNVKCFPGRTILILITNPSYTFPSKVIFSWSNFITNFHFKCTLKC